MALNSLSEQVQNWVGRHSQEFTSNNVRVSCEAEEGGYFPEGKAVLKFKHRDVLMQIDLWGSGQADVMLLRKRGRIKEFHEQLAKESTLGPFLTKQWHIVRDLL